MSNEPKKRRTFHNLKGFYITKACCNSDGEPVKGTEEDMVVLYNSSRITDAEMNELVNNGQLLLADKRICVIVPTCVAMNLSDKREEDEKTEVTENGKRDVD